MTEDKSSIINKAHEVFDAEIQCLQDVRNHINETFFEAVNLIYTTSSRVIVTGVGKSAIVAQKIVATFNSTGTPAIFMHAADAIHGDLGIIQENDLILALSKSGDTPEIKVLIPFLKTMGNKIIGMVSNQNSTLAREADVVLYIPVSKEADPNNLAPTSSTTAQMAMGDALAIALLTAKGFSDRDFAKYHPGGNIGKQLYMCVKDLCHYNGRPSVKADANLKEIIVTISSGRLGVTAVEENGQVIGIITDGDLRRMLENETETSSVKASDIMTRSPKTIQGDELAVKALQVLQEINITQLLVMNDDLYIGVIHIHDLLKEGFV